MTCGKLGSGVESKTVAENLDSKRQHKIIFQIDADSFSFLSWNNNKVLFLKKYDLSRSL